MTTAPFLDKTRLPTRQDILGAIEPATERWIRLDTWTRETYGLEGEPIYLGKDTGWGTRYRRSSRALFTLIPRPGALDALVVIGPSAWGRASGIQLSPRTRAAWDAAHPYPDGRWLVLHLDDDETLADLQRLVALKSPPPRRVRRRLGTESG